MFYNYLRVPRVLHPSAFLSHPCKIYRYEVRCLTSTSSSSSIKREVLLDQGYPGDLGCTKPIKRRLTAHEQYVVDAAILGKNLFVTGLKGSGKSTLLRHVGLTLQAKGKTVVFSGVTSESAMQLNGITAATFLGTRNLADNMRQEQVEGVLERHVRLMNTKYNSIYPTLVNADVVVLDEIHLLPITVLQGLDAVARKLRNPDLLFGGLQIIVSGNFFELAFTKDMPHYGYAFQSHFWESVFPFEQQVALLPPASDEYRQLVLKAVFGTLTKSDVLQLEKLGVKSPKTYPMSTFLESNRAMDYSNPRFPRFTSQTELPRGLTKLRATDVGWAIADAILQYSRPATFSLPMKISIEVGDPVEFVYGTVDGEIQAGELAIVTKITDVAITVRRPFSSDKLYVIHPMRIRIFHETYPDVHVEFSQFPIHIRKAFHAIAAKYTRLPSRFVELDCRFCTEVNSLGTVLSSLDRPVLVPGTLDSYLKRDGMVHEATKLNFEKLFQIGHPDSERWCKNCKRLVSAVEFDRQHWSSCISASRWCSECDVSIPLPLWDAHAERHTVVLCFDCGRQLQWRDWENHRRGCPGMLREISPDNLFIPSEVRALSLSLGHNRRELHHNVHISPRSMRKSSSTPELFS